MGLISGLISVGRTLLGAVAPAVAPITRQIAPITGGVATRGITGGALSAIGRAITSPFGAGIAGGAVGVAAGEAIFGGDGAAVPTGLQQIQAQGGQVTSLSGGRFMAIAPNGDMQVFNRMGMPVRPSLIIPAGTRLPGGATVVSIRQGGALIGITRRRRRRAFATEVRRVRSTIQGCRAVLSAAEKPRRRSAHA